MLEKFIEEWFPKTTEWNNIGKFILESGVDIVEKQNSKWLPGYTNISRSSKPHHEDEYIRYMEESMFMLHDICHNIFTINTLCSEEEYVKRQIYGELFTFYLTEYVIPSTWKNYSYRQSRGCYDLMESVILVKNGKNIIDHMWSTFIDGNFTEQFSDSIMKKGLQDIFEKYSKMFKEDLENSRKNYKFVPKLQDYCMVGKSSQNHIDFFEAVKKGAIKNIKREFNLELPTEWI